MKIDFSQMERSINLPDERGRVMHLPNRNDYINFLIHRGFISNEKDFQESPELNELVYLHWLRRGQVGCIFAQLLGRSDNRSGIHTSILCDSSATLQEAEELAQKINMVVQDAVANPKVEAVSVLLPKVLDLESIILLLLKFRSLPGWKIEREWSWRKTLVLIGLRAKIADKVWAEILGLGPFASCLPPTRQGPVTSLEIRTKPEKAPFSNIQLKKAQAAHLAQVPTKEFLSRNKFGPLFDIYTPWLKKRMLSGNEDKRAKASVTFAVPAALWNGLKSQL